ncbi:hypothetical protein [Cyanobacterium aponinum]|uniref:hypothetical protein n=1 Tax=Cyanobacterium aponinum TaxID=379064 RepID=UPI000C12DF2E|nr:hypothetical protein [Cyanobacterium aponinum]PHV61064.1 hypothetical protein CSQ80_17540 [Cyanobacterium aponinum IPPAS B-1201]
MANKSPVMTKEFENAKIKAIGTTEKMGSKVFGIRFPEDVEKELLAMPQKERVPFIRELVIDAIRK